MSKNARTCIYRSTRWYGGSLTKLYNGTVNAIAEARQWSRRNGRRSILCKWARSAIASKGVNRTTESGDFELHDAYSGQSRILRPHRASIY